MSLFEARQKSGGGSNSGRSQIRPVSNVIYELLGKLGITLFEEEFHNVTLLRQRAALRLSGVHGQIRDSLEISCLVFGRVMAILLFVAQHAAPRQTVRGSQSLVFNHWSTTAVKQSTCRRRSDHRKGWQSRPIPQNRAETKGNGVWHATGDHLAKTGKEHSDKFPVGFVLIRIGLIVCLPRTEPLLTITVPQTSLLRSGAHLRVRESFVPEKVPLFLIQN
jgi:hypothetical protein